MNELIMWTWLVCGAPLFPAPVQRGGRAVAGRLGPIGSMGCRGPRHSVVPDSTPARKPAMSWRMAGSSSSANCALIAPSTNAILFMP